MEASNLETTIVSALKYALPAVLSLQLFLGGQARLTRTLTPRLHAHAMRKADGTHDALWFIPIADPARHTQFIGALMMTAGALVAAPATRVPAGAALTLALTTAGVNSQARMGLDFKLPAVNSVLAVAMWLVEERVV
ncbi:MAG: hypothetical protein INR71_11720 [Terriglobus roseus]|nr:hypothetical protein [Terriglobus roseus]